MANTWKKVWMTPFEKMLDSQRWQARIYGHRSDDKIVYVDVIEYAEDFKPQTVGLDIANALDTLDVIWKEKEPINGD